MTAILCYSLKFQADAWNRCYKGHANPPIFHAKLSFTIPDGFKLRGDRLRISKIGWMYIQRSGSNPYPDGKAKTLTIKNENGKWCAIICCEIDILERQDNGIVAGVDWNAQGQVTRLELVRGKEGWKKRSRNARQALRSLNKWTRKLAQPEPSEQLQDGQMCVCGGAGVPCMVRITIRRESLQNIPSSEQINQSCFVFGGEESERMVRHRVL